MSETFEQFDEHIKEILTKMCEFVGTTPDKVDFDARDWYWQYQWTEEEQEKFKKWLIEYLKENSYARKTVMRFPRKNSAMIKKVANTFIFNYGWKIKK